MMVLGAVVAILMDLGRLTPAYAADPVTVTGRRCSVPLKPEGAQPE